MSKVIDNIEDIASIDSKVIKVTSTDNAVVRFDGTTGQVQNSSVIVDDSGNVGIGTSSPDNAITVYSNPLNYGGESYRNNITLYDSNTVAAGVGGGIAFGGNYNGTSNKTTFATISTSKDNASSIDVGASLIFKTRGSATSPIERMRIDSAGNVGLGVTPSAWHAATKAFQVGTLSLTTRANSDVRLNSNNYYNGTNDIYISNDFATQYNENNGSHIWKTAPLGTAGNPITWNTAMALGSNGNLLVGTTTDNGVDKLQVNGSIRASFVAKEKGFASRNSTFTFIIQNNSAVRFTIWSTNGSVSGAFGEYVFIGLDRNGGYNPIRTQIVSHSEVSFSYSLYNTYDTLVTVTVGNSDQGYRWKITDL